MRGSDDHAGLKKAFQEVLTESADRRQAISLSATITSPYFASSTLSFSEAEVAMGSEQGFKALTGPTSGKSSCPISSRPQKA